MSALALILVKRGYKVSGSDSKASNTTSKLIKNGIKIFETQCSSNIHKISIYEPLIVISSAISQDNPELKEAYKADLKIYHRSDILASLVNKQPSIIVAGSHGKTTTSTIISTLFKLTHNDPTIIVGGIVPIYKSNANNGKGKFLIAEGDESDGTLIKFKPEIGVITNLELDHTDHYENIDCLIETMKIFEENTEQLLVNFDCDVLRQNFSKKAIWLSIQNKDIANYAAIPVSTKGSETIASFYEKGEYIDEIIIPLPGLHNLSNALSAIATCRLAGISFSELKDHLKSIMNPLRRFEFQGIWEGKQLVDDYAHHPSEIKATISMARLMINSNDSILPEKSERLIVVFQPHRFSRTKDFLKDFCHELGKADLLLLAPIYSSGEKPIDGINSKLIACCIKEEYPNLNVINSKDIKSLELLLRENTKKNDLILIMGAGDINSLSKKLLIKNKSNPKNITV